jgi:hypothetical protein
MSTAEENALTMKTRQVLKQRGLPENEINDIIDTINGSEDADDMDKEAMLEAMMSDRGAREDDGSRDEWSDEETMKHMKEEKYDSNKKKTTLSSRLKEIMKANAVECDGCTNREATVKIMQASSERAEKEERAAKAKLFKENCALAVGFAACICAALFGYFAKSQGPDGPTKSKEQLVTEQKEAASSLTVDNKVEQKAAPTWREVESLEEWDKGQEKQFAKAYKLYSGIPDGKERWKAIGQAVADKTKGQCYNHHKLLLILAEEEAERQKKNAKNKAKKVKKKKMDGKKVDATHGATSADAAEMPVSGAADGTGGDATADALAMETLKMYGKAD